MPFIKEVSGYDLVRWVASYIDYKAPLLETAEEVEEFERSAEAKTDDVMPLLVYFDPLPLQPGASEEASVFESLYFVMGAQMHFVRAFVSKPELLNATQSGVLRIHNRFFDRYYTLDLNNPEHVAMYSDNMRKDGGEGVEQEQDEKDTSKEEKEKEHEDPRTKVQNLMLAFLSTRSLVPFGEVTPLNIASYQSSGMPVFYVLVDTDLRSGFERWFTSHAINNTDRFLIGYINMFVHRLCEHNTANEYQQTRTCHITNRKNQVSARLVRKVMPLKGLEYPSILHVGKLKHLLPKGFTRAKAKAFMERCLNGTQRAYLRSEPVPAAEAAVDSSGLVRRVVGATFYREVVDTAPDVMLLAYHGKNAKSAEAREVFAAAARTVRELCGADRVVFAQIDVGPNEVPYTSTVDYPHVMYVAKQPALRVTHLPANARYGTLVKRGAQLCHADFDERELARRDQRYASDISTQWVLDFLAGKKPGPKPAFINN